MNGQTFKNNFGSPAALYDYALRLYNNAENKELEKLFARFLKKSYDLKFWSLYIEYVKKISTKKVNPDKLYSFVLGHFEHSYYTYGYIKDYLQELLNSDEDGINTDTIRKVYHRSFQYPMFNLGVLWNEYEKWEQSVNKLQAKSFIEKIQPTYNLSFNTYQRLIPYIENNQYFRIFDIELENPLKLNRKSLDQRLNFLFNFYISKFPENDSVLFLYSFYLKDMAREVIEAYVSSVPLSPFLSYWLSFQYSKNYFNFGDESNIDMTNVNYLNWIVKNEGIEALRSKFNEMKHGSGPHCYIFAAEAEFYQGNSKELAYQVFIEGTERFPHSPVLSEEFFDLFLKVGDDNDIRLLFKKLRKTNKMWDKMIEYELLHGEMEDYRNLVQQRQTEESLADLLPENTRKSRKNKGVGCEGVYESVVESFCFLDLKISFSNLITEFLEKIPVLPPAENILSNLDNYKIVEILARLGVFQ